MRRGAVHQLIFESEENKIAVMTAGGLPLRLYHYWADSSKPTGGDTWVGEASVPEFSDLSVGTKEKKSPGNGKNFPVFPTFH